MSALVVKNESIDVTHKIFLLIGIVAMFYVNMIMSKPPQTKEQ